LGKGWLALDFRGNKHDDLVRLGFVKGGSKYSHPLIAKEQASNNNSTSSFVTWESLDQVVTYMLTHGIPNASMLDADLL
jgi:hypothetical protein